MDSKKNELARRLTNELDETNWKEAILETMTRFLALAGGPLSAITYLVTKAGSELFKKRIQKTVDQLYNILLDNSKKEKLLSNDGFIDATYEIFEKIGRQHSELKRNYYKNIYFRYIEGIKDDNKEFDNFEIFVKIISNINDISLSAFVLICTIFKEDKDRTNENWYSNVVFPLIKKQCGKYTGLTIHELINCGLIVELSNGAFATEDAGQITELGMEFMDWILSPSDSEEQATS